LWSRRLTHAVVSDTHCHTATRPTCLSQRTGRKVFHKQGLAA
jgi:hypothetical protein